MTEVHPTAAIAAEQSHKAETWPFGSLSVTCPWPFEERANPAISFGRQGKPDFSYMYGGTDCEGEPLYRLAPMESEPAEIETPLQLLPPSRRCSCYRDWKLQRFDFSDSSLDDNNTSREDMIQDVQYYTSDLDLDANDPT